jgi:hypothetical protein
LLSLILGEFSDSATFWHADTRFYQEGPQVARQRSIEQPMLKIRKDYKGSNMSAPRQVLDRRVKISKTGRPYVNVPDLVKRELERIKKSEQDNDATPTSEDVNPNGNGAGKDHCE